MLINLSDHPSNEWTARQIEHAKIAYDTVEDLRFPTVEPNWKEDKVLEVVMEYVSRCMDLLPASKQRSAVHISGEATFTVAFVSRMHQAGVPCITSTTEPMVEKLSNRSEKVHQRFVRFRKYLL